MEMLGHPYVLLLLVILQVELTFDQQPKVSGVVYTVVSAE